MSWNVVLQLLSQTHRRCDRFTIAGLPRPSRILIVPCDPSAVQVAIACHKQLQTEFASKAKSHDFCPGPIHPGCMTWDEAACAHVLVPVISQAPVSQLWLQEFIDWSVKAGLRATIMPAIAAGLNHAQVFAAAPAQISRLQLVPWGGNPARLASLVLQRALYGERPGLFISYRRQEAASVADQIFDEMTHRGFRVFLDRFSGTSGRYFPQEIAEELAERDVVLVLETPNILQSRWTLWEIAFARTYRLGLLSLQWPRASAIPSIVDRRQISPNKRGELSQTELRDSAAFIERRHTLAALTRRAFYEGLVEAAAQSKNGSVQQIGDGVLQVLNRKTGLAGFVAPSGRPGRLPDVHRLVAAAAGPTKVPRLLAGQHGHLPPTAKGDLNWLAATAGINLSGRADIYKEVRGLL